MSVSCCCVIRFAASPSGVKVQQLSLGKGPTASLGDSVVIDYVLRRANGYFIYSTVEGVSFQPTDLPVGPVTVRLGNGSLIEGLEQVIVGKPEGTVFRALVPPPLGYREPDQEPQPPTFATKRQLENHKSEPLLFEVRVAKVRKQS